MARAIYRVLAMARGMGRDGNRVGCASDEEVSRTLGSSPRATHLWRLLPRCKSAVDLEALRGVNALED